ncbi:MAG: hypothetical protein OSP8Acid_06650 [uncultured Acidilobus sp. OSP8]|nr:MAG: hypothetical protein OSP8Acid_06650 [uncultured Acidilobus sp. OSP8]
MKQRPINVHILSALKGEASSLG